MLYELYLPDFRRFFSDAKNVTAQAKRDGIEIPDSLEKDLQGVEALHSKAKEECYTNHNEEAADALIRDAIDGAHKVLDDALKCHLSGLFQKACDARKSFKGHEDLARDNIPNYRDVHSKNLSEIKKFLENWVLYKNDKHHIDSRCDRVRDFLKDFEAGKPGLSDAIYKAERAKWMARIGTGLTCVVIILSIIGIKGCSDSSQQAAQPGAVVSGAENSTQTP